MANQIIRQLIYNLKNNIDNYSNLSSQERLQYRDAAINRITYLANEYDQKEIINEVEK